MKISIPTVNGRTYEVTITRTTHNAATVVVDAEGTNQRAMNMPQDKTWTVDCAERFNQLYIYLAGNGARIISLRRGCQYYDVAVDFEKNTHTVIVDKITPPADTPSWRVRGSKVSA